MEILLDSNSVRSIINRHGPLGMEWVEELPGQLEHLSKEWNLSYWESVPGSVTACVFFVKQDQQLVVLKAAPDHPRLAKEAQALREWAGSGLVPKVLGEAPGCYLMSRIMPGTIWQGEDSRVYQALELLHSQDSLRPEGIPLAADQLLARLGRLQVQQAGREMGVSSQDFILAMDLIQSAPESGSPLKLLHTDLHPRAILHGEDDLPHLVDPSPAWGPAAWDLAAWIAKNGGPKMEQRLREGCQHLNYSTEYVRQISRAIAIEGAAVTARYQLASQEEVERLLAWGRGN